MTAPKKPDRFPATRWSLVVAAGDRATPGSHEALARLCALYRDPLYAFVRSRGHDRETAEDLVQGFFARFLGKNHLENVDAERGRFRSYLLGAVKHYLSDEHDRASAKKRGGGQVPLSLDVEAAERLYGAMLAHDSTPERAYDRMWARALLDRVVDELGADYVRSGRQTLFEALRPALSGDADDEVRARAHELGLSDGALRVAVHRLRRRYRDLLRAEIADTVASEDQIDDELRHLLRALAP
jgi:RNA polymerase sigma-70 factor (ECF subfamily)